MAQQRIVRGMLVSLILLLAACAGPEPTDDTTAAMAAEHDGDTPVPTPAGTAGDDLAVDAQKITYGTLDDDAIEGFEARPAEGEPTAGIIVIHEWWGLNENIEGMTKRLAGEGYLALAVDLYDGQVAEDRDTAQTLMGAAMGHADRAEANLRQAYAYLAERVERIGVIGWCFGGGWSLRTALMLGDDLDAAVMYYGRVETDPDALATLSAPLLGHFASEDRAIPLDAVRTMEAALDSLGKDATIHVYDGTDHAFANPSGTRYDAAAAEEAWERTTAFLAEHLGG